MAFVLQNTEALCQDSQEPIRGYKMIRNFSISNFRCFDHLNLQNLSSINILVGDNGSGKTAILEALLLSAYAHPKAPLMIRQLRNRPLPLPFPSAQGYWDGELFQSLWEDLFFDSNNTSKIVATFDDSLGRKINVEVFYENPLQQTVLAFGRFAPPLVFERKVVGSQISEHHTSKLRLDIQGNPVVEGLLTPSPSVYIIPSTSQFSSQDVVNFFSSLTRQNLEKQLITALQKEFPDITDVSIVIDVNAPGLFVSLESTKGYKLPLSVVSSGAARYLNILAAIATMKNGILLVDEIENGIYWKKMPNIWKTLRDLCVERGVQIFATTHSNECLRSLVGPMKNHEDCFSLIRAVAKNGKRIVRQFDGLTMLDAIEGHGEIR